jgi:hypothetical protein
MLTAVRDAAGDQDLARFVTAIGQLHDLDQARLDAAAQQLTDLGASTCRPPG